jgi:CRP/FNR family transcriptional regulator, cyclic AMP receptor protein
MNPLSNSFDEREEVCAHQPDFLDRLNTEAKEIFLNACVEMRAEPGEVLFRQGSPHVLTYLIDRGLIRTYYLSPLGKEITLAFWSDGNLIGGPDMFGSTPHVWSAQAIKDTRLWVIDGRTFRRVACGNPVVAGAVMDALAFKVHWLSVLFQTFATESVTDRLAHQIVRLSEMYGRPHPEGTVIAHEFTQEDLANMVGATRQWVSITLNELQRAGLVGVDKRRLILRDLAGLRSSTQAGRNSLVESTEASSG